jgi:hypothetical protein
VLPGDEVPPVVVLGVVLPPVLGVLPMRAGVGCDVPAPPVVLPGLVVPGVLGMVLRGAVAGVFGIVPPALLPLV